MKFGIFGGVHAPAGGPESERQGYLRYVDTVLQAEALGYHSSFLVEHHFSGGGQVSASLNLLAYLAARTSRIRLGTAVVVLPWHNPILVAEQVATVDLLSDGRFDFGVGRGYRYNEFHGFCIPIEEASERFEEAMAVIRKAFTTEGRFSHHGKRWHYEEVMIEPGPVQKPHPPLWLAAGRPESLKYAADNGYRLFLDQFQTFEVVLERLSIYRAVLAEAGRPYDPLGAAVARGVAIVNSEAEREAAIAQRMAMLEVMNAYGRSPDGREKSSMVSDDDLRKAAVDGVLMGSAAAIIERLRWLEAEGVGYVLLSTRNPEALRTFARDVMPAFA
jgi:alkanesulfonate monooxygenase SsuD/methylene tetrahydromethanopterin reductase-like flavin-dependent oxidoreductase (luciferase family)